MIQAKNRLQFEWFCVVVVSCDRLDQNADLGAAEEEGRGDQTASSVSPYCRATWSHVALIWECETDLLSRLQFGPISQTIAIMSALSLGLSINVSSRWMKAESHARSHVGRISAGRNAGLLLPVQPAELRCSSVSLHPHLLPPSPSPLGKIARC